jgi:adenine-specific DNA-methyltransferase
MNNKQKLELTWIGKGEQPKLEPRILIEDPEKSYGDPNAGNMLIYGDNLLALKALEQDFAGKIKCIYIDPPYNTGSAFDHFDDSLEHSIWLTLISERIRILWELLHREFGSIWISIDDREMAYLKVLLDEVCGRNNFLATNVWQKRYSRENREAIGDAHEYILVYARNPAAFKESRNLIPLQDKQRKQYSNPDNDPRGPWQSVSLLAQGYRPNQMYEIVAPNGHVHRPPPGNCWKIIRTEYDKLIADNRVYFGRDGNGVPRRKEFLSRTLGVVPWTWWPHDEVGHTGESKNEANRLFGAETSFGAPKPERLMKRILEIATNPGDIVLDSFLGSGTTAAVAHKMNRKWIGIELGEHCHTHCIPRLKQVCDGTDQGGISKSQNWKGGGGFKYYYLAPSLLQQDNRGNWVINKQYNAAQLAAAMAKHEGFRFSPDETLYWKQGKSTEKDFIFTTTNFVSVELVDTIHAEMKTDESLLICCTSFSKGANKYPNINIKKIPKMLLGRCEFGKEDYSLNIINMPKEDGEALFIPVGPIATNTGKGKKKPVDEGTGDLFEEAEEEEAPVKSKPKRGRKR